MRSLILTFDCLPRRWLGCYGSLDSTTRGFDRIAALGTIFENAISQDVRTAPQAVAGLSVAEGNDESSSILAKGEPVGSPSRVIRSADFSPAPRRTRKKPVSRLGHELHDALHWLREQHSRATAWIRHPGLLLSSPPIVTADEAPELLSQLALLDDELDGFLDEWTDCADVHWTLIITAARGVSRPRALSRRRTPAEIEPSPLNDDLVRVPLIVLDGVGEGFGKRELSLVSTNRIGGLVADPAGTATSLREAPPEEPLLIVGDNGRTAVRSADWLFVRSTDAHREAGDGRLFSKPEDACDAFDVRSAQADVALELDGLLEVSRLT